MITTHMGQVHYTDAAELLAEARSRVVHGGRDELLLVRFDPVVTVGARGSSVDRERLRRLGVEVVETVHGGPATWFGPGQVVGFPIVDLRRSGRSLSEMVAALGGLLIEACDTLGLAGVEHLRDRGGVFVDERGLGRLNVTVQRDITIRAFTLNVSNALDGFPALAAGHDVTSLSHELGETVAVGHAEGIVAALARGVIG